MQYTILIAEDDKDIVELLRLYLENSGYRVISADNGEKALELMKREHADLALLDVMMPRMDGYELTRQIRRISNIPVLILSARDQDYDRILGLNLGADDYLTKPFNPMEVAARIHSNLRRFYELGAAAGENRQADRLILGELCLDAGAMTVSKNGEQIFLTPTEYKILLKLMRSPGRVYTKAQIYESINGEFFENDDRTMMVHISKLREKIEDDPKNPRYIKTVRGLGYKIEDRR
ncbi:MAG TPA: response regulator transcription factor [Candidatus Eisenbergiella intestinipullorum]|nr:response regulator transcription factor [Candidatus Eisenbergiella intestinipullorum]